MSNRVNLGRVIGLQGEQGIPGVAGQNGADGETPRIVEGIWWIGTISTGVRAEGNAFLTGQGQPTSQGINGDLYLDETTCNVYHKENGIWVLKVNIKGSQGEQGERGESALTFEIGEVESAEPTEPPSVTNVGTETDIILNFTLPRGEKGEQGEKGDSGNTTVYIDGQSQSSINFSGDPQTQLNNKVNRVYQASDSGKVLAIDSGGNVVPQDNILSVKAYIVGSSAFEYDWLSFSEGGEYFTPDERKIYLIKTTGEYYNNQVVWNESEDKYELVTGGGGGLKPILRYAGQVQNYSDLLELTNVEVGDVYDVVNAHGEYPAGTNYAWNGTSWDALGGSLSTKADKVQNATNGNFAGLDSNGNLTDSGAKAGDFENITNKVTSLSSTSTDDEYPTAKCVYTLIGDLESILNELDIGGGV